MEVGGPPQNLDSDLQFKSLSFNNNPSIVTHIEGISAVPGGFSITATEVGAKANGASYAFIPVKRNGSFGTARWVAIENNVNGAPTTGDTVIDRSVMGIYPTNGGNVASYISTVANPMIGRC